MGRKSDFDPYEVLTKQVLAMLEEGVVPWRQSWRSAGPPANLARDTRYRGANVMLLAMTPYEQPWWLTFNQVTAQGGKVKQGEHGRWVYFWTKYQRKAEEPGQEAGERSVMRTYRVFNVEQCTGLEVPALPEPPGEVAALESCEAIAAGMPSPPGIQYGTIQPHYNLDDDMVRLPRRALFDSPEEFYSTQFHELARSTAHPSRVGRPLVGYSRHHCEQYAEEELTAEMAAAMLGARAGIFNEIVKNSAAYIAGWTQALRDHPRMLVRAGGRAQKAVDWILGERSAAAERDEE